MTLSTTTRAFNFLVGEGKREERERHKFRKACVSKQRWLSLFGYLFIFIFFVFSFSEIIDACGLLLSALCSGAFFFLFFRFFFCF